MQCPNCGHEHKAEARFCSNCGHRLDATCYRCGHAIAPEDHFCSNCGAELTPEAAERFALHPEPIRHPLEYTPDHLARKILRTRTQLEGERRIVTVLYCDAQGFTSLSERVDAEQAYSLIKSGVAHMLEAIHKYEGTITQFRGDGVMALFGAPIAHEDSARRAVAAGLEMQGALEDFAQELRQEHGIGLRFRVGLHTGPVVVGKVHDDLKMDYTAHGDTANLAQRMEEAADPGTVYLSQATYQAVRDYFEFESVGELQVRGREQAVQVYRAVRARPLRTRFEVAAERGLSPFVGRGHELELLTGFMGRVKQGAGQVVFLSGEAGIGKSRLLLEFHQSIDGSAKWLEGHCISFGGNIPYLPIIDLLKQVFGIAETDSEAQILERIDERTARWKDAARSSLPYLRYLLNVDPRDASVAGQDPKLRRAGIFDSLRVVMTQESEDRPLVLIIEDLHWIDEQSETALSSLVEAIAAVPVLMILTYRPGYKPSLGDRPFFTRLAIGQLATEHSAELAQGVLESGSLPAELLALLSVKAEGNPFFIEEVAKSLVEGGSIRRVGGRYELTEPLEKIHIPNTIQEVILTRIDRLDPSAKAALQLASVIGREFTVRLLDRIAELELSLEQALGELKALELIFQKDYLPELSYMFKHALTHDVAYQSLLQERRRELHRLIGIVIEDLYADRLADHFEVLAYHYLQGQEWPKALDYLTQSGEKAASSFAMQDALDYYQRAIDVAGRLGESAIPQSVLLLQKRAMIRFATGRYSRGVEEVERVQSIAQSLGARELEGMAISFQGLFELFNHDPDAAERTIRGALAIGEEGLGQVRFFSNTLMSARKLIFNQYEEVDHYLEQARALLPEAKEPITRMIWTMINVAKATWEGRFDDSLEFASAWLEAGESNVATLLLSHWQRGMCLAGKGDYEAALTSMNQALEMCERIGENAIEARLLNSMGWAYTELQDHRRAMRFNNASIAALEGATFPTFEVMSNARVNLADNLLMLGEGDEAEKHLVWAEKIARNPKRGEEWGLRRIKQRLFHSSGELWLARGNAQKAIAYAEQCLELAEPIHHRKNVAKGRRLRAQAYASLGRIAEAGADLEVALDAAQQVGNPTQLWKTHAAIAALRAGEGELEGAREGYREARAVIQAVADGLEDRGLRDIFIESAPTREIQAAAS